MTISAKKIKRLYPDGKSEEKEILVIKEHRLSIKINGRLWCSLVCTEDNLIELVSSIKKIERKKNLKLTKI